MRRSNLRKKLGGDLVHHTGTMIRFTTSQLPHLPPEDKKVTVILPDGTRIPCKFHLNPANPYIAGPRLVKWIKTWIPFGQKERAIVYEFPRGNYTIVPRKEQPRYKVKSIDKFKLLRKLLKASKESPKTRHKKYNSIIRERVNSELIKKIFGHKCQVEKCEFTQRLPRNLYPSISEVHHLEHLCKGGTNSPYNIAVVCANHHAIFHRDKTAKIGKFRKDDVLVSYNRDKIKKWIKRNLSILQP